MADPGAPATPIFDEVDRWSREADRTTPLSVLSFSGRAHGDHASGRTVLALLAAEREAGPRHALRR